MDPYMDGHLDIDDVFPDDELGPELGDQGMGPIDLDIDFFDPDQFDPQPGSPNANLDRPRQSSRTNEPSVSGDIFGWGCKNSFLNAA